MNEQLVSLRKDYDSSTLIEGKHPESPYALLQKWIDEAMARNIQDANAMDFGTIDLEGFPASRIVLLRGLSEDGLIFYTNYSSAKGQQLTASAKCSANFFWPALERQVRVRGFVQFLSTESSDKYFESRPRDSKIGAWASPQSSVIAGRDELDMLFDKRKEEFSQKKEIPRPPFWGGYVIKPNRFEFWQGRPSRLHDRLKSELIHGNWSWSRLAP